ncbi:MAG: DUF998 domain-containing protein [Candidatus Micrarchaeota archaeon]
MNKTKMSGFLLVASTVLLIISMLYVESLYPSYSRADNYISDLGVGPTASIFNTAAIIAGLGIVIAAALLFQNENQNKKENKNNKLTAALLGIAGIGITGIGVFPENTGAVHVIFTAITFLFGALAAIASSRNAKSPTSKIFVLLGLISLVALTLIAAGETLGLGVGGIERLVACPLLLWTLVYGAQLLFNKET